MEKSGENPTLLWKMFIGEYRHSLDKKRRMALPVKFRKELGKKLVITKGFEKCLVVYPLGEWKRVVKRLEELPSSKSSARSLARIFLSGAVEVELDSLGRALIPEYLVEYAGLKKEVVVIGLGNRIELWSPERWEEYRKQTEQKVEEIAEGLEELQL